MAERMNCVQSWFEIEIEQSQLMLGNTHGVVQVAAPLKGSYRRTGGSYGLLEPLLQWKILPHG